MTTVWTDANPWTDDYLQRELATMQHLTPYDDGQLVLDPRRLVRGVIQCYLRADLVLDGWGPYPLLGERLPAPLSDRVWMSITPQEIESQYMPIALAEGRVGIGGLGLGYAAQRILSKPNVAEVVVYETNPRIIQLYERSFAPDPKLTIRQQDVGTMQGESFDLFYNDVYAKMLEDQTFEHWVTLTAQNDIGIYHPWGLEAMLMSFVVAGARHEVPFYLRTTYFPYLAQLQDALRADEPHGLFATHYLPDIDFARQDAEALGDIWS